MPNGERRSLWLRFADEVTACPACGSVRIRQLDAFRTSRAAHKTMLVGGCESCGLLFANPLPAEQQLKETYADDGPWAAVRAERMLRLEKTYRHREREGLPPKARTVMRGPDAILGALRQYAPVDAPAPGAKALDFGCGDGKFLDRLQDRGWDTYGIEPSTRLAFVRHHRLVTPPQDRSFGLVIVNHVLEHLRAPLDVLKQLAGCLQEGGVIFVSTPRMDTLPEHRDYRYCIDGHRHIMCFTEQCLTGLLARAGFVVTGRLDARELDERMTEGKPLRLRLVAARADGPIQLPLSPLASARETLRAYRRSEPEAGMKSRLVAALPVRLRAALLDRHGESAGTGGA